MKKLQKGFTLIELMIVVAIIGILAAIAIPNFIKFQARSKQSEAKANLKASFTAMKAYYQEKDKYSSIVTEIGFVPERNNRYAYFLNGGPVQGLRRDPLPAERVRRRRHPGRGDVGRHGRRSAVDGVRGRQRGRRRRPGPLVDLDRVAQLPRCRDGHLHADRPDRGRRAGERPQRRVIRIVGTRHFRRGGRDRPPLFIWRVGEPRHRSDEGQ